MLKVTFELLIQTYMRYYILSFTLFFISNYIFAQKIQNQQRPKVQVTGKVIDKQSGQALEYATLIFTPTKGKKLTGGITDMQGQFDIDVPAGSYSISVEFLSFKTKKLPIQKITIPLDLGTISLDSDMESIGEVEIIAEKSTVEIRLDKKIYHVGKDMTVKGGTASDVLDNVPSVTVDVEGTVSLRGNESVRILVDGKPSGLVGLSATDALRQLPAEAIQKVEVITSPSARYDAEGTAGIINIILRKSKALGFNASTTLSTGIPDNHGISANVNYRADKFNIFTNLGYSYRDAPGNSYSRNYNTLSGITSSEELREYQRMRNGLNSNIGLEYYLSDDASITGSFLYRNSIGETDINNNTFSFDTDATVLTESYRNEIEDKKDNIVEYAVNFTQNFKANGHKLTFDTKYQDSYEDESSLISDTDIFPYSDTILYETVTSIENEQRLLIKTDYVLPIGEKQQFEAGFQNSTKKTNTDYEYHADEEDVLNILDYQENIFALYTQYGNKFGKFSTLMGLRMEVSDISVEAEGIAIQKNYNQLFPTLNLSYELNDNENITLGYNRRIRRPHFRHMSPFETRSSTTNIFKGNPDLDPIFSDGVDIGYLKKWNKLTCNTSIYYRHTTNAFQYIREDSGEVNDDGIPIIITTPINLNNEDRIGLEFSLNYNPAKWLRLSNSFNFYQFKTNGIYHDVDYTTTNESWFNRFNSRIKLFKEIDFQTTIFYRGPYENAVSKREALVMANVALSKDILKDNGTLAFNVSDVFNTRKREMETYFNDFTNYSEHQWRERQFKLSFTYRFNQKKKRSRPDQDQNGGENFEG